MINIRPVLTREEAIDEAVRRVTCPYRRASFDAFHRGAAEDWCFDPRVMIDGIRAEYRRIMADAA
jgi:hypothetical protein